MINTKREYKLLWDVHGETSEETVCLDRIVYGEDGEEDSEYEYIYALQDDFDTILDLKIDEIIPFQFNRDDKREKGIVKRIR